MYLITNEPAANGMAQTVGSSTSSEAKKTHIKFKDAGEYFGFDDLDVLLCNRLGKQRNENKFTYLFNSYERISAHIVARRKGSEA